MPLPPTPRGSGVTGRLRTVVRLVALRDGVRPGRSDWFNFREQREARVVGVAQTFKPGEFAAKSVLLKVK